MQIDDTGNIHTVEKRYLACHKEIRRMSKRCPEDDQRIPEDVQKMSRRCPEDVQRIS